MHTLRRVLSVAIPALACAGAHAVDIYAVNTIAPTVDGSDELIIFDPASPDGYTVVGSTGVPNIGFGGLEFDAEGNLWAFATLFKNTGGAASGLYSVNPATGAASPVGGTLQTLQDLAYNPVDGQMYGMNTRFASESTLFRVDLGTGVVTPVGLMTGFPERHYLGGLAVDSAGTFYVVELETDTVYSGDGSVFTQLYTIPQDIGYSQGMTVDWSRADQGYHGSVGQGVFPNFFSTVNTFGTDGSGYSVGLPFGPNNAEGIPPVQPGDLAVVPSTLGACDMDGNDTLNVDDIDVFVAAFLASDLAADFDGNGSLNVDDIDAFVACFLAGT